MDQPKEHRYPEINLSNLLSIDFLSEQLKVSKGTVADWILNKGLPGTKLGHKWYVSESDFIDWFLANRRMGSGS